MKLRSTVKSMAEILDKQTIKALGADARQDIMKMLAKRPYTASELAKITHKHVTTVTEHLTVLEKSGLVKKKDSTNKWVYYTLSDKGEHLFKPQFYSWVIAFSLSVVMIFVGFLRMFRFETTANKMMDIAGSEMKAPAALNQIYNASTGQTLLAAPIDYVAYSLIVLGIIGFAYLAYRKYAKK